MSNTPPAAVTDLTAPPSTVATSTDSGAPQPQVQTPDPVDIATRAYQRGLRETRERVVADLQKQGFNAVLSDTGEVDYKATLASVAAAAKTPKADPNEVAALREMVEKLSGEAARDKADKEQYIIDSEIATSLSGVSLVEGAGPKAKVLFKAEYDVKRTASGEVRVYQGGKLLLGASGDPLTVAEAVERFTKENPYLVSAHARGASPGTASVPAGVKVVSQEDMRSGRVSVEDLIAGKVIVQ